MKLLVQALYDSSTNKYRRYFPYPMNLLKIANDKDFLIDLNRMAFGSNADAKEKIVKFGAEYINTNASKYQEVIINCGEYAPDGAFYKYFDKLLKNVNVPVSIIGSYPAVFKERIKSKFKEKVTILDFDLDVHDVILNDEMINDYPRVDGDKKVNMKLTQGCPRTCSMCPVSLIHQGKYRFFDISKSIELIKYYYNSGVRFFNFIDDLL